ncbi:hypothetical protein PFTANZ_00928 [Plasmodium falciparum Tanzania (2000708)]|uniref:Duffy-binding-like domain-containing protein n=1 Tax=Plasmodium falciparum Tanzania (2000708) TaxID=1036725 RepID=A0A024WCT4_PLAFA|nr:hypothetical protein PFTANZ_00928 [Plasmodium falciparum Tanzania (2000708)]
MSTQGPRGGGGGDGIEDATAKHALDRIGEEVYKEVKGEAEKRSNGELAGQLSQVSVKSELIDTTDTCDLVQKYYKHTNGDGKGERYPCKGLSGINVERFSDKIGGQCTNEKMRSGGKGACAPYRRLHLCHHNLESIQTKNYNSSNAKHDLLLEVCMAAYYEGDLIKTRYTPHQQTNPDSQLCTVLARSFADIGDIVRGKDLFLGNDEEKKKRKQLDNNLKDIFAKIYHGLTDGGVKSRYNDATGDFFQLREDWWDANRLEVWKAITCKAEQNNKYFRKTACAGTSPIQGDCRCNGDQVPTYFDYVPQYLRWFEEWAEDFCRLRKRKLEDAKNKCRGKNGKERYCSGNGFDCKETVRGNEQFVEKDCHDCSYSCSPFVKWLDNQKLEFLKQKNKYTKEMQKYTKEITRGGGSKKRGARASDDNGYEKKFYGILKTGYNNVNNFLEKLNEEDVCKKKLKDVDEEGRIINFKEVNSGKNSDGNNKTFARTKICEPCPWCGTEEEDGKWKAKNYADCGKKKKYNPQNITNIPILTPEKGKFGIYQKYNKFCTSARDTSNGGGGGRDGAGAGAGAGAGGGDSGGAGGGDSGVAANSTTPGKNGDQIVTWQCYYDKDEPNSKNNDNCVEGTWENFTEKETVKSYNGFFWDWVYHMLHDSLDWRNELGSCINKNKENTCKTPKKCNKECTCFAKWVEQKKTEWTNIKNHFGKQENIGQQEFFDLGFTHENVLEGVLNKEILLKSIEDVHANAEDIKRIGNMLEQAGVVGVAPGNGGSGGENKNTSIDKFLQEELNDATKCQKDCPKPEDKDLARAETGETTTLKEHENVEEEEDDDEEEEEEEGGEVAEKAGEDSIQGTGEKVDGEKGEPAPKEDEVKPACTIVAELFQNPNKFSDACGLKYGPGGKERFPNWKCVSSGDEKTTTSSDNKGGLCIPPRRRKLYVTPLTKLTGDNTETSQGQGDQGKEAAQEQTTDTQTQSDKNPQQKLLHAFVKSAAVETFFLWDRYKKIKEKEKKEKEENGGLVPSLNGLSPQLPGAGSDDPQSKLEKGEIPNDFLRLMFYTLGDYRDICIGKTPHGIDTVSASDSGDNKSSKNPMQEISDKIKKTLNGATSSRTPGQQPSDNDPKAWWKQHAESIWNGMICALTYDTNTTSGTPPKQNEKVRKAFFGEKEGKNTLKDTYTYETVTFIGGGPSSGRTLSEFATVPHFIRWLEEWGGDFCRKRKIKIQKIKNECRSNKEGKEYCDGDGYDCYRRDELRNKSFIYSQCPGCEKECIKYKKWIGNKRNEFNKQKKKFQSEIKNLDSKNQNTYDEEVYKILKEKYPTFQNFVERLNECPYCINSNVVGKINFDKNGKTFGISQYCKACPVYGVTYNRYQQKFKRITEEKYNSTKGSTGENKDDKTPSTIEVLMLDRKGDHKNNVFIKDCNNGVFFEDASVQKWQCQKTKGVDQCKLTEFDDNIDDDENMEFNVFFQRWLRYFVHDYNKLKDKIKPCIKNGNKKEDKCINGCKKNCECVKKWLDEKAKEWNQIKIHYEKHAKSLEPNIPYGVKRYFDQLHFDNDHIKAQDVIEDENERKKIWGCTGRDDCTTEEKEKNDDFITNLIDKLQEKIGKCKTQHSDNPSPTCVDTPPLVEEETNPLDDDTSTTSVVPEICKDFVPPEPAPPSLPEQEEKDKAKEDRGKEEVPFTPSLPPEDLPPEKNVPVPPPKKPETTPKTTTQKPETKKKPETTPKQRKKQKRQLPTHTSILPEMLSISSFPLTVGLAFAALSYFLLKVIYKYI